MRNLKDIKSAVSGLCGLRSGRKPPAKWFPAVSIPEGQSKHQKLGGRVKDKKTEITVETYEVLLIRQRSGLSRSWCASCSKQVALISLDDACMSGLSIETIQRQVGTGRIHLIETAGGSSSICLSSLIQI